MKFSKLKTDKSKEVSGVWVDTGLRDTPNSPELRLLIARQGNEKYNAYVKENNKSLITNAKFGRIDTDEVERINKDAAAKHVVLGWENLEDENGQPIPFTSERCRQMFDESHDFYVLCMGYSQDISLYQAEQKADNAGN
jgi:hypothetical protein